MYLQNDKQQDGGSSNVYLSDNNEHLQFFPPLALQPKAGHGLLVHEVSRSHKTTHRSR